MGETLTTRRRRRTISVTGTKLKIYALISLVFYTAGICVVQNALLGAEQYSAAELARVLSENSDLMLLSTWAALLRLMGGLGVPVFAFLLVEGFVHTGDLKRYLLALGGTALLSEIPYDLAMSGKLWDPTAQNGMLTLTVCLVMLYGLRLWRGKPGLACRLAQGAVIGAAALWCDLLRTQSGLFLVVCVAILYQLYQHRGGRLLVVVGWTLLYVLGGMLLTGDAGALIYLTGTLSVYALWCYNGQRGWKGNKYLFYLCYPAHLLALYALSALLAG